MSVLEAAAALVTVASIWLATRENVWYFPTGIVSVVLYAYIYFDARLYAEAALQVVWLVLMLYGWYEWLHGGESRSELPVSRTPRWGFWTAAICGASMTAVIVWIQRRLTDNPAPLADSAIAAWSIVAQWMTARKWIESWVLWVAVNMIAVPLYLTRALWITAALYAALFILAIKGYRDWRRSLAE